MDKNKNRRQKCTFKKELKRDPRKIEIFTFCAGSVVWPLQHDQKGDLQGDLVKSTLRGHRKEVIVGPVLAADTFLPRTTPHFKKMPTSL